MICIGGHYRVTPDEEGKPGYIAIPELHISHGGYRVTPGEEGKPAFPGRQP